MGSYAYAACRKHLQRDAASRAQRGREATREVAAAGHVLRAMPLGLRGEVRVAGTGNAPQLIVVAAARIGVLDDARERRAAGLTGRVQAGKEAHGIGFLARGCPAGATGRAASHEASKGLLVNGKAGR